MNFLKISNNSRYLLISTAFHIFLLLSFVILKDPVSWQEQTLNIELVGMSSFFIEDQKTSETSTENTISKPEEKTKNAEKYEKNKKAAGKKRDSSANKQTSGQQSKDAIKDHSAQTDPIFNAAYLNNPAPIYPDKARFSRIEGKILLNVLVSTDGVAKAVTIKKSSGSHLLDEAALDAVRNWKFVPAKRGGELVEATVMVPIEFKLK